MAEIPTQFRGTMYDLASKSSRQVFFDGYSWRSDVSVGHPLPPAGPGRPGGPVDPGYGYPERPADPGYGYPDRPVDPGYGISADRPAHPIIIPPDEPPPENPPDSQGWIKPPPEGGWGYHVDYHWLYNPGPGQAGPKR